MLNRRKLIGASAALLASGLPSPSKATGGVFPPGFLWGAATAGHQIEGSNVNSDFWLLENVKPTIFVEPSGDACNSFALWPADLDLVRDIGLNSYRFSLEWSRIEPEPGLFSIAMLDHYKAIIDGCRSRGLTPVVTFNHWTVPRWFAARGGWTNGDSAVLFARYCERAAHYLASGIGYAATLNEANGLLIYQTMAPAEAFLPQRPMLEAAGRVTGSARFVGGPSGQFALQMLPNMLEGHRLGRAAIKSARTDLPVGLTLAVIDVQGVGADSKADAQRKALYGPWLDAVRQDDFVGVQNYSRMRVGAHGVLPPPAGTARTADDVEIYPKSLANSVRYVHEATGRPILVTEHGLNTHDDAQRAAFIPSALGALHTAMRAGLPVLGYLHWSLLDNFEWMSGYKFTYGLASVDRRSFRRMLKPSAAVLGAIARNNAV